MCGGSWLELFLGRGADKANSGGGSDRIEGGGGQDLLNGGEGPTSSMAAPAGHVQARGKRSQLRTSCVRLGQRRMGRLTQGPTTRPEGLHEDVRGQLHLRRHHHGRRAGSGPWYAPARPDTSLAHFLSPSQTPVTFSIDTPGVLTITMQKVDTSWYSGHIQTVNKIGEGFAQRYGYFEARMAFEKAVSWPAFWLYTPKPTKGPAQARAEIDVIEAYGDNDYDGYHMAVHRRSLESQVHKGNFSASLRRRTWRFGAG